MNAVLLFAAILALVLVDVLFNKSRILRALGFVAEKTTTQEQKGDVHTVLDCVEELSPPLGDCSQCVGDASHPFGGAAISSCSNPSEENPCFRKRVNRIIAPAGPGGKKCTLTDGEIVYEPCPACENDGKKSRANCASYYAHSTNGELANQTEADAVCDLELATAINAHCNAVESEVQRATGGPYSCTLSSFDHFAETALRILGPDAPPPGSAAAVTYDELSRRAKKVVSVVPRGASGRMRIHPAIQKGYSELFLYFTRIIRMSTLKASRWPVTDIFVRGADVRNVVLYTAYDDLAALERVFGSENAIACDAENNMMPLPDLGGRLNRQAHVQDPDGTAIRFRQHPPWLAFRRARGKTHYLSMISAHPTGPDVGAFRSIADFVAECQPPANTRPSNGFLLAGIKNAALIFHCPGGDDEFFRAINNEHGNPAPIAVRYVRPDGVEENTTSDELLYVPGHPEWLCYRRSAADSTYTPAFRFMFPFRTREAVDLVEYYNTEGELHAETDGRARRSDRVEITDADGATRSFSLGDLLEKSSSNIVKLNHSTRVRRIRVPPGVSLEFDLTWTGVREKKNKIHEDGYTIAIPGEFEVYFTAHGFSARLLPGTELWDKFDRFVDSESWYSIDVETASTLSRSTRTKKSLGALVADDSLTTTVGEKYASERGLFSSWDTRGEPVSGVFVQREPGFGNEFGTRTTDVASVFVAMSPSLKIYVVTNIRTPGGKILVVEMKKPGRVETMRVSAPLSADNGETTTSSYRASETRPVAGFEIVEFIVCLKPDAVLPTDRTERVLHTNDTTVRLETGVARDTRFLYLPSERAFAATPDWMAGAAAESGVRGLERSFFADSVFHEAEKTAFSTTPLSLKNNDASSRVHDVLYSLRVPRGLVVAVQFGKRTVFFAEGVHGSARAGSVFPVNGVEKYSVFVLDDYFVFDDGQGRFMRL